MRTVRRWAGRRARGHALLGVLTALALAACGDPGAGRGRDGGPGDAEAAGDTARPAVVSPDSGPGRGSGLAEPTADSLAPTPEAPAADGPLTGFDTVFAYFTGPDESRVAVARAIPDTARALRAAFQALLRGPTPAELEAGLQSWFSDETAGMLASVTVTDGFAVVDFRDLRPIIPNAVGSAGALMLMGELTATAFQFPGVRRVEFRIDGDCEALMAWLQFGCYPITRSGWEAPEGFRDAVGGRGGATP